MTTTDILSAIPSTESASFNEFLGALEDVPTDSIEWRALFDVLDHLESVGLVEIDRGYNNRINELQLTEAGAAHVRELVNK